MARFGMKRRVATAAVLVLVAVIASCNAMSTELASPLLPAPAITQSPSDPTGSTSATFHYSDATHGVGFECSLDGSRFTPCAATGTNYRGLARGNHTFRVRATSGSTTSQATSFRWNVAPGTPSHITPVPSGPTTSTTTATTTTTKPSAHHTGAQVGVRFTITNTVTPPLYPGTSQRLDLVFTNPNPSPITIAPRAVSITVSTGQARCSARANFAVTQGLTSSVTIPANQTRSLSDLGIGQDPLAGHHHGRHALQPEHLSGCPAHAALLGRCLRMRRGAHSIRPTSEHRSTAARTPSSAQQHRRDLGDALRATGGPALPSGMAPTP